MLRFLSVFAAVFVLCCGMAFADRSPVVNAVYTLENSNQFNSGTLYVIKMDNVVVFELSNMKGSESEEESVDDRFCGSGLVERTPSGIRMAKCFVDETREMTIKWHSDHKKVSVFHKGSFKVNPDGVYLREDYGVSWTEGLAQAFLEALPSAATSLNKINRPYRVELGTDKVRNGKFYPVKVIHETDGETIAEFLLSVDMKRIKAYRIVDSKPVLIYGDSKK